MVATTKNMLRVLLAASVAELSAAARKLHRDRKNRAAAVAVKDSAEQELGAELGGEFEHEAPAVAAAASALGPRAWDVIGPFPTSAREQGAAVLEAFGGIRGIPRGGSEMYPSELASSWNGAEPNKVGWTRYTTSNARVEVDHGDMRWDFLVQEYGQSIQRGSNWAIGDFNIAKTGTYAVVCHGIGSYWVDDQKLPGDAYWTMWRGTQPLKLTAGTHTMWVPFGTYGSTKTFDCSVDEYADEQPLQAVLRGGEGGRPMLFPDVVDGRLASTLGSVVVESHIAAPMEITAVEIASATTDGDLALALHPLSPRSVLGGQAMPLRFDVTQLRSKVTCAMDGDREKFLLTVKVTALAYGTPVSVEVPLKMQCRKFDEPFKFTFADADGSVQYAGVRTPGGDCPPKGCPVIFATHGASVESDPRRNAAWAGSYKRRNGSWLLLPTNRDAYGYDWQMVGMENGRRALAHLAAELPGVAPELRATKGVDADRLVYSGHSMGGHGCLEFLTKFGDRAMGAVPASGWIRMNLYPYDGRRLGDNLVDPALSGIMWASMAEYDPELHVTNAVGIPVLMRIGANDTSVPPWHLRRFARLMDEESRIPNVVGISEIEGKGHWFGGIVDDDVLGPFYDARLAEMLPALPQVFTLTVMNPATTDGRGGMKVEQLDIPYRVGRVHTERTADSIWKLSTENIRRLSFYELPGRPLPSAVVVDGEFLPRPTAPNHLCKVESPRGPGFSSWDLCRAEQATEWLENERSADNYGPLRQVFHTAPLVLVYGTGGDAKYNAAMEAEARFLAQATYYQGRFAIQVLSDKDAQVSDVLNGTGAFTGHNVIVLGGPHVNALTKDMPTAIPWGVDVGPKDCTNYAIEGICYDGAGIGALFLSPLKRAGQKPRLALVVAGNDLEGFEMVASMVPVKSGLPLPDYVLVEPAFKYKGFGGIVAAGYYDNNWNLAETSGYWRSARSF